MNYKEIDIRDLNKSAVKLFDGNWALLTAGAPGKFNSMTVSWGALGFIWGFPAAFTVVRPQRYTYEFMEKSEFFTLSFFPPENHKELSVFGSKSGRDFDKFAATGLKSVTKDGFVYVDGAEAVLFCRKIAFQDINPAGFIDGSIAGNYNNDYHRMFIGNIQSVLTQI